MSNLHLLNDNGQQLNPEKFATRAEAITFASKIAIDVTSKLAVHINREHGNSQRAQDERWEVLLEATLRDFRNLLNEELDRRQEAAAAYTEVRIAESRWWPRTVAALRLRWEVLCAAVADWFTWEHEAGMVLPGDIERGMFANAIPLEPPALSHTCTICERPIEGGAMVGTGDGTGQRFAHRACFDAQCDVDGRCPCCGGGEWKPSNPAICVVCGYRWRVAQGSTSVDEATEPPAGEG